jgi:hypothetical protein
MGYLGEVIGIIWLIRLIMFMMGVRLGQMIFQLLENNRKEEGRKVEVWVWIVLIILFVVWVIKTM